MGEMSLEGGALTRFAPLLTSNLGATGQPMAMLGGHGDESPGQTSEEVYGYGYAEILDDTEEFDEPIHVLFMGFGVDVSGASPISISVDIEGMSVTSSQSGGALSQVKFESFEFFTYSD
jgi:hypothetical protein